MVEIKHQLWLQFISLHLIFLCIEEEVTSGKIKVNLKYVATPAFSAEPDLCNVVEENGLSCPLSAGEHTMTTSTTIPGYAPLVSVSLEGKGD